MNITDKLASAKESTWLIEAIGEENITLATLVKIASALDIHLYNPLENKVFELVTSVNR